MTAWPAAGTDRCPRPGPAATGSTADPDRSLRPLRVVTLNVWNTFGPWPRRRREIIAQLVELAPDIVCLQEVVQRGDYRQATDLANGCAAAGLALHSNYEGRPFEDGLLGNAVLTRAEPIARSSCPLPVLEDGEAIRIGLAVRTPQAITVTVHLSPHERQRELRVQQCHRLREFLVELRAEHAGVPLILAGDLNCGPDGPELAALQPAGAPLIDCWQAAGTGRGHTWLTANPFTPAELTGDDRFDYLLYWPADELPVQARAIRLFGANQLTGTMLSDHLGVVVDLG